MHRSFHPFFSKQRELRGEIDRQTQQIADLKTRLSAVLVELSTAKEALHARIKAHEELLAEQERLQEAHTALTTQYNTLAASYDVLEAERDRLQVQVGKLETDLRVAKSHRKKSTTKETVAQEKGAL